MPYTAPDGKTYKMQYANAKSSSGRNGQVGRGTAYMTCAGGLKASDLVQNASNKWVSRARSAKPLNAYMQAVMDARSTGAESFNYKGNTYVRSMTKTGLAVYKKA